MPLFGVRYLHPDGPLIAVSTSADETARYSAHADCLTWVVAVDNDHPAGLTQIGEALAEHDGRCTGPTAWITRPAPPTRHNAYNRRRRSDRPRRDTIESLLVLDSHGRVAPEAHTRAALHRRGWTDITGRDITASGREAAARFRAQLFPEAQLAGATS